ncbi:hypothetical protein IAU60_006182 [Kwoniella sp. DSM 27419]
MSARRKPSVESLVLPAAETAVFQHSPHADSKLKREWEPGCQPDEVYDQRLPAWRAWLRRWLVTRLREEKDWMAKWQRRIRSEGRDKYFYWTAIFGTHEFFTAFLPVMFFFGYPIKGRGLLYVVGLGIYTSSFAKDLVCTPRPYSPPVIRLSMSTHHHEYGFPSSHSTNSVSIALFLGECLYEIRDRIGHHALIGGWILLSMYATSIVAGRLYTGMHSTADVIAGIIMGAGCWALWLAVGSASEAWVNSGSWLVPAISVPLSLSLVHYHPFPIDDCPCFEDAIAILAVILGSFVGHWLSVVYPDTLSIAIHQQPIMRHGPMIGTAFIALRIVIGLAIVFTWRIVAKFALIKALPSTFRLASSLSNLPLPTRRFYKAATDYKDVPNSIAFRTIPSVIDLQIGRRGSDFNTSPADSPQLTPQVPSPTLSEGLRARRTVPAAKEREMPAVSKKKGRKGDRAKYDVEVLTKVVVYSGIGLLATTLIPPLLGQIERMIIA